MDKPKIRFQGFEEAWCKKTLGDFGSVAMNKRIFKNQTSDKGDIPFYKIGTFGKTPDSFISKKIFAEYKSKYPYPKIGDILISASGSVGKIVEYKGEDAYFQDSNIVWLDHKGRINNKFLKSFYSIVKWAGLEGSTIKRLYNSNILQTSIKLPSLPEQEKIGKLFERIDHLLNLQQRKCDKLNDIKKSMLTKMFPKPGKRVPEVRFEGFTDDWVECKISDLFKITRGNVLAETKTNSKASKINPYPVYSSQTKKNGLLGYYSNYLYEDAITWTTDGANAGTVKFRPGKFYCTNVCGVLLTKTVEANPMIAEALNMVAKRHVSYVGNPKLMNNVMADISLKIPLSQKERTINSNFFHKLDTLIHLSELKLSKLRLLKRSFLEGMFV